MQSCINGSSEMLTNVSMSLVNILFNAQLMKYAGADGVVAYGIIMIFVLPLIWGLNGIWLAVVFAEILSLVVSIMFLVMNRKKYQYA